MSCPVGATDVTFGSIALNYFAEAGVNAGASVPKVNTTPTGVTAETWCPGDVKEFTDPTATAIADRTVDVLGLVGTTETLTFTYVISNAGNSSNATLIGQAFLQSAGETTGKNALNVHDFVWTWEDEPVYTVEAV